MNYRFYPAEDKSKAVVFLHGWGASMASFEFFYRAIKGISVLAVDFAGFGESPEPSRPYTVEDYADELNDLISNLNIKKVIFVCHSFGGRVAIKYNYKYNSSVVGNIFIDIAGIKPRFNLLVWLKIRWYKFLKKLSKLNIIKNVRLDKFGSSDYRVLSNVMKATFKNVISEDLSDEVKKIRAKTLIIWGREDRDTKIYMAKKINRLVKGSILVLISGDHFAYLDNRYRVLHEICNFIGEVYA